MAEQDVKENEMTVANSVDYVRGLSGKTSVLIALSTLLSKTTLITQHYYKLNFLST